MATASLRCDLKEQVVKVTKMVPVTTVFIELSDEEAVALGVFMSRIGGCPRTSLRKYADTILDGLRTVGYGNRDVNARLRGGGGVMGAINQGMHCTSDVEVNNG